MEIIWKAAQTRLEKEKDKHQEEIIAIQESYKERVNTKLNETQIENELLKAQLNELQSKLAESTLIDVKISSSKSDDGWCINGKLILAFWHSTTAFDLQQKKFRHRRNQSNSRYKRENKWNIKPEDPGKCFENIFLYSNSNRLFDRNDSIDWQAWVGARRGNETDF